MPEESLHRLKFVQTTRWATLRRTLCIAALATAGLMTTGGCSLLLDFGGDEPTGDGGINVGSDAFIIPPAACMASEPNNEYASPVDITPGTLDAAICPGVDKDYYRFELTQDAEVTITATFDHAIGDLGMELYRTSDFRPELTPVATVDTQDDNETVTVQLTTDIYIVQIYSNLQGENLYTLDLTVQ